MRREAWEQRAERLETAGYKFLLDFLTVVPRTLRIDEVPVTFRARRTGTSKVAFGVFWELLVSVAWGMLGGRVPRRWISFVGVGGLGMVTDAALTGILHAVLDAPFAMARLWGIVVAMTQNYVLNNRLTFKAARRRGAGPVGAGWIVYTILQGLGATVNWSVSTAFHSVGVPWNAALVAGVAAGSTVNFMMTQRFVWGRSL